MQATARAVVIGESLIDIAHDEHGDHEYLGGSPANVAVGIARLELPVAILTQLGSDERGARWSAHFADEGVEILPGSLTDSPTSTAHATIRSSGAAEYEFEIEWAVNADAIPSSELVHVGSLGLFLEPGGTAVFELLTKLPEATVVTVDPNIRPSLMHSHASARRRFEDTVQLASLVKLSDEDAAWLYPNLTVSECAAHAYALTQRRRTHPSLVVVTLGAAGAYAFTDSGQQEIPAVQVHVADTISAGDSFMASLIASALEHGMYAVARDPEPVLQRAARAAAYAVSAPGAHLPRREHLE